MMTIKERCHLSKRLVTLCMVYVCLQGGARGRKKKVEKEEKIDEEKEKPYACEGMYHL